MNLHTTFVQLGRARRKLTNKMLAILPAIYEKGIYKKYASTIEEYAGKFGGIPKSAVKKRLKLEEKLIDKPELRQLIGEEGIHKVSVVATIATPETDSDLADKVRNMSKSALETMARELRGKKDGDVTCSAQPATINIELDAEMSFIFLKLKKKLGEHLSNKEVMRTMLSRMAEIEFKRAPIITSAPAPVLLTKAPAPSSDPAPAPAPSSDPAPAPAPTVNSTIAPAPRLLPPVSDPSIVSNEDPINSTTTTDKGEKVRSRYIPVKHRQNDRCVYPGCNKPVQNWHHVERFSRTRSHKTVIGLCHDHHEFMHNGLIPNESTQPDNWQLNISNKPNYDVDLLYRKYRQESRR